MTVSCVGCVLDDPGFVWNLLRVPVDFFPLSLTFLGRRETLVGSNINSLCGLTFSSLVSISLIKWGVHLTMVLKLSYTVRTPGKIFSILINPACVPDQSHQNLWAWQLSVDIFTGSLEFRSFVQKQCFSNFNVIWTTCVSFQTFRFQFPRSGMGIMHFFFFF